MSHRAGDRHDPRSPSAFASACGIATATAAQLVPKVAFKWVPGSCNPAIDRMADICTALFLPGVTGVAGMFVEWALLMPVILLGGIYSGYFSATESAAVALLYALVVELFVHKEMKIREYHGVVIESVKLSGAMFPLLAVALSLNLVLTEHRVPAGMVALVQG